MAVCHVLGGGGPEVGMAAKEGTLETFWACLAGDGGGAEVASGLATGVGPGAFRATVRVVTWA